MKVLYSDLKKLVPGLSADPQKVGEALTLTGFMLDGLEEVKRGGEKDQVLSFEVRHNRADGLSVFGLAREVAAYFGLKVQLPEIKKVKTTSRSQMIGVLDKKFTKRVLAFEINGIKNSDSPDWLKEYLACYGMNSKNLLVDLSNYVMLLTGYPSHLLDKNKINGKLLWDLNKKFDEITTLDGSLIKLTRNQEIILRDEKGILALAGIVGGKKAEIDDKTDSIICEMGIYDPGTVRKNAVSLGVTTEAGTRLSRYLNPKGLENAMALLVDLILENAKTEKTALRKFEFYPKKHKTSWIKFDLEKPTQYAGVTIPEKTVQNILDSLGFAIKKTKQGFFVMSPEERMDIELEEDVIEEVVRVFGFDRIPFDETPALLKTPDITPKTLILIEKIRDALSSFGFDEILSHPLVKKGLNASYNHLPWSVVIAENPVNEEYCEMRQSIAVGLFSQMEEYLKQNLEFVRIFEVGKIFGRVASDFKEHDSLGILALGEKDLATFRENLEKLFRSLGISDISYRESKIKPEKANPFSCFDVFFANKKVGMIYKLAPSEIKQNVYFTEINLLQVTSLLQRNQKNCVTELLTKNLVLDANLELNKNESPYEKMKQLKTKIGSKNFFSLSIVDIFPIKNKIRYTFRATYQGLSDPEAKKLHLSVFGLKG